MAEIKIDPIKNGVNLTCYTDPNFKTVRISINMLVPLKNETAANYGILPALVSRASKEYPDYTALGQKLAGLYGAYIDSGVNKLGAFQVLTLSAGGISSRYAFDGEDMVKELSELLFSILFEPLRDKDFLFDAVGFEQEKRQTLELFDAEFNDKITYARRRAQEILFGDSPAGINRYGTKENVQALSLQEVSRAWDDMLQTAQFEIFMLGDCEPDITVFEKAFSGIGNLYTPVQAKPAHGGVKETTEKMQLSQSKLVLGFYADMEPNERAAFKLMTAIYGGTPSSKLFINVREKMSLCYYCAARFDTSTATMMVESGVETENILKAREAILKQLELLQSGEISEEEILSAKLAVCTSYRSINDSLQAVETWYVSQSFFDKAETPEESAKSIMAVTKEEIIAAANKLSLDTVYMLKGEAQN